MNAPNNISSKRYMPGLDGLRALSVLAVIAYHLNLPWASGGFLGVSVFFTLSGYLITDQLINEWHRNKRINLKYFWLRRVRRLFPAMLCMVLLVCLWLLLFDNQLLGKLKGDFISVLFYFNNWWLILHNVSYFDNFGPPSPIGHLWSLAIEEQFYIFWPLVLAIVLCFVERRGKLIFFVLMAAVASALAMALLYVPGTDPSRVYYGTDTRAFALLLGAALAMYWPSRELTEHIPGIERLLLDLIGAAGLIGILLLMWHTNEYSESLYVYGFALFAVLSTVVTAVLAHPASTVAKVMGCQLLRWIGVRSYSLYIWHFPIIALTSSNMLTATSGKIILQLGLSFLLADLSYRLVEEPIRRNGFGQLWRSMLVKPRQLFWLKYIVPAVFIPLILFGNSSSANLHENKVLDEVTTPAPTNNDTKVAVPAVAAIGDSIILDAAPYLEQYLPGMVIDGQVGRQMFEASAVVERLKTEGKLAEILIIELGTNGPFNSDQFRNLLTTLGDDKQIILVNVRVPRRWQDVVNADLAQVAADFPNVTLVDWYYASKNKQSFFAADGVHLTPEGAKCYAKLISDTVLN